MEDFPTLSHTKTRETPTFRSPEDWKGYPF